MQTNPYLGRLCKQHLYAKEWLAGPYLAFIQKSVGRCLGGEGSKLKKPKIFFEKNLKLFFEKWVI
jgi:hypothetical protein